jgi:serine/threonine-protein kinase RsbW
MTALDELSLEVPPEASFISMARMFAGSVARHFWVDEERVDDIKIAVSEACTYAVKAHQTGGITEPVRVRATAEPSLLTFEVIDLGKESDHSAREDDELEEDSLGLALIHALFEISSIESGADGTTVRFSIPIERHKLED